MPGWHGLRRGPVAQHCKCRWQLQQLQQLQRLQRLQRDPVQRPLRMKGHRCIFLSSMRWGRFGWWCTGKGRALNPCLLHHRDF